MAQIPYTSPALIGQGFERGVRMRQASEEAALKQEVAGRLRQEYERNMEFIPLDKIAKTVPEDLQGSMLNIAAGSGYVREVNGTQGIHRGELKEFMAGFQKNLFWQSQALDGSIKFIDEHVDQLNEQLQPVSQQYQMDMAEFEGKLNDIAAKEAKAGYPLSSERRKIQEQVQAYQASSPVFKQLNDGQQRLQGLMELRNRRLSSMGKNDRTWDELKMKYGAETAWKIANGLTSEVEVKQRQEREAEDYKHKLRMKQEEDKVKAAQKLEAIKQKGAYSKEALKEQGKLERKILELENKILEAEKKGKGGGLPAHTPRGAESNPKGESDTDGFFKKYAPKK